MRTWKKTLAALTVALGAGALSAQTPAVGTSQVSATGTAALVNGEPIPEADVQRALRAVPQVNHAAARPEIVGFMIDNKIVDQYLTALKVQPEPQAVDALLGKIKSEVVEKKQDFSAVLKQMGLTEPEMRAQIANQLRWEKFVDQQADDAKLQGQFAANLDVFDGTRVKARHILITPTDKSEKGTADAAAKLRQIKASVEQSAAAASAKIDPALDAAAKEQAKQKAREDAFGEAAKAYSSCPSKDKGGDLGWFPRSGAMVEPFARAAFATKTMDITDVVQSEYGVHLIMPVARKQGEPIKFTDPGVKDAVKEFYAGRLRDAILAQMKPKAKIEVTPVR